MPDLPGAAPELDVRRVPLDALKPHPQNYNRGDVAAIRESIRANGIYRPVIVANEGTILAGHHVFYAVRDEGHTHIDVVVRDVDPDSAAAKRIMIVDNKIALMAQQDHDMLLSVLGELRDSDEGLAGSGWAAGEYQELLDADDHPDGGQRAPTTGERLALLGVGVGEPEHQPHYGQTWIVGRHVLVVARLLDGHPLWAPLLEGRAFVPYPEVTLTCATIAAERDLLLVQPNLYLAGHLLDVHARAFPDQPCHPDE